MSTPDVISMASSRGSPTVPATELLHVLAAAGLSNPRLDDLHVESIFEPIVSATAGLWRVSAGSASAILKVLRLSSDGHTRWQSGADPEHWYYWRREACAYASGLLGRLTGSLRAPRCYGTFDRADGGVDLWLEDMAASLPATDWDVERYGLAAEHLGAAQGAWLGSGEVLDLPWLSRRWLPQYVERREDDVPLLFAPGAAARLTGLVDETQVDGFRRLWEERAQFLELLDRAPRTVCHYDLHPKNLFADAAAPCSSTGRFPGRVRWAWTPERSCWTRCWTSSCRQTGRRELAGT